MPELAELTHDVLVRVAEFLRKLPADQLAELARGDARLEVVPKGARIVSGPAGSAARSAAKSGAKSAVELPRPVEEIHRTMVGIGDRVAARRYLAVDLKLTVPQLKALAAALTIAATGTKAKLVDGIVESVVGRQQDADVFGRLAGGTP